MKARTNLKLSDGSPAKSGQEVFIVSDAGVEYAFPDERSLVAWGASKEHANCGDVRKGIITIDESGMWIAERKQTGRVTSFRFGNNDNGKEGWQLVPGGISSLFHNFANHTDFFREMVTNAQPFNGGFSEEYRNLHSDTEQDNELSACLFMETLVLDCVTAMEHPTINIISKDASRLIGMAKIEIAQKEWWNLLPKAFVAKGDDCIFGDLLEVAFVKSEGDLLFLVTESITKDRQHRQSFTFVMPRIDIETKKEIVFDVNEFIDMHGKYDKIDDGFATDVLMFLVKLFLVKNCSKTPVESTEMLSRSRIAKKGAHAVPRMEYLSLSKRYYSQTYENSEGDPMDKAGKKIVNVEVSGFLRSQPYGKGRTGRRTIWVDGFVRRQWMNEGIRIVKLVK